MEYIYGPPPPPPPPTAPPGGNGNGNGQNRNSKQTGDTQQNKRNHKQAGNRPGVVRSNEQQPQQQQTYLDLPTHLPNAIPNKTQDEKQQQPENEVADKTKENPIVPVFGTNIVLKTDEDIQEWIKQRKQNWMKKISNTRPESEKRINNQSPRQKNERSRDTRPNRNQNRVQKPSHNNNNANKPNLNRLIIQRELQHENTAILDVIKELFKLGILEE